MIQRLISFILVVIFIFQTAFQAFAMTDLEKRKELFKTVGVLQTSKHFPSNPDKTGGGILPVATHEGKKMSLVALRNDDLGWCNFGGASDAKDETVGESCSREAREESLGVYAIHRRILERFFSHDLYSPETASDSDSTPPSLAKKKVPQLLFYRMYITPVEYVPASIFKEKLEFATDAHHKEYKDFVWVPLQDLLEVAQGNTTFSTVLSKTRKNIPEAFPTETSPAGEDNTSLQDILFEPFFEMLKASPVQDHLKNLLKEKDPSSPSSFTRESHTVSLSGSTEALPQSTYVVWETVLLEENPNVQNFLAPQKPHVRTIFLGNPPSAQSLFDVGTEESPEKAFILGTKTLDSHQQKYSYSEKRTSPPETVLYQETVSFDQKQAWNYFVEAFTAKAQMNLQFKREMEKRSKKKYETTHAESPSRSAPSDKVTPTEAHLRLWLGESYLPRNHKANIKTLIEKVGLEEELRREAELTEEALDYLSHILDTDLRLTTHERLQEMPFGYETFYHGCRQEMITLYQAYSALENLFTLQDRGEFSALRGTFSYMDKYTEMTNTLETFHQDHRAFYVSLYNQYKSENRNPKLIESSPEYKSWMEDQKEKTHSVMKRTIPLSDYKEDNGYLMLWLNAILTAGRVTTNVTSSTIEYFLNSHSVKEPCDAKLFQESMALRGIEASYQWFQSLYEQYISPQAPEGKSNGGLLQVFVNTAWQDLYSITLHDGSGTPYGHPVDAREADRAPYVSRLIERLQREAQKQDLPIEKKAAQDVTKDLTPQFEESARRDAETFQKSLVSEVCLFLHPLLTQTAFKRQAPEADPETVEALRFYDAHYQNPYFPPLYTKGYLRYPLFDEKKEIFDFKLSQVASALMADWLSQGTKPLEGGFYETPKFFDFYRQIYKDFTAEEPPQETYKNSLPYLINMGDVKTVRSFLNLHPDALTTLEKEIIYIAQIKKHFSFIL